MEPMEYLNAFWVGGLICVIGQLLIDLTKLTPARIMVLFVTAGVALGALGLYGPLAEFAGCGATVPLTGFGWALSEGVRKAVAEEGFLVRLRPVSRAGAQVEDAYYELIVPQAEAAEARQVLLDLNLFESP